MPYSVTIRTSTYEGKTTETSVGPGTCYHVELGKYPCSKHEGKTSKTFDGPGVSTPILVKPVSTTQKSDRYTCRPGARRVAFTPGNRRLSPTDTLVGPGRAESRLHPVKNRVHDTKSPTDTLVGPRRTELRSHSVNFPCPRHDDLPDTHVG